MKKFVFGLVLVAGVLAGCGASEEPPGVGFNARSERIARGVGPSNKKNLKLDLYLVQSADRCELWGKGDRWGVDYWRTFGEVDCAAVRAVFSNAPRP